MAVPGLVARITMWNTHQTFHASKLHSLIVFCLCLSAGVDNFYDALEDMIGYRPNPWMKWSWAVITPLLCVVRACPLLNCEAYSPKTFSSARLFSCFNSKTNSYYCHLLCFLYFLPILVVIFQKCLQGYQHIEIIGSCISRFCKSRLEI